MNWILPLLKPSFWFNLQAVPFMPWLERFLPFFLAVLLLASLALQLYIHWGKKLEKDVRRFLKRLSACAGWASVAGGILYFFQWQYVPYLTMRIYWLFWIAGFGYWGYLILHERFRLLPAEQAKRRERDAYEKWLPKPKGGK